MTDTSLGEALDPIGAEARGREITGLGILQNTSDDITMDRAADLMSLVNADQPAGGMEMAYGEKQTQHLRFCKSQNPEASIIIFVHGGSWRSGTHLDSLGFAKVNHLTSKGYAFGTINYSLIPDVSVEEQVQEVANSIGFLSRNAPTLHFNPQHIVLMGHSSGAHVVTLLGTDSRYLEWAGVSIQNIKGVVALDGSNYNALAEIADSPDPVAENTAKGLGTDPKQLRAMSPVYHAGGPRASAVLLLHIQRKGDNRQAIELDAALKAAGTDCTLHVFEGQGFEGHIKMLLRLGESDYPAMAVMDKWLEALVPLV